MKFNFFLRLVLLIVSASITKSTYAIEKFTANGPTVKDNVTGLVWARCSVGQNWDGNICTGEIKKMAYEQAVEYAKNQKGWRLPNKDELESLIDKERKEQQKSPTIDMRAFPNTGTDVKEYWSSSLYLDNPYYAWIVDFGYGRVYGYFRYGDGAVHLVRAND